MHDEDTVSESRRLLDSCDRRAKAVAHPLSKIGRMYREHMQKNHPLIFNEMVMTNTWTEHLQEIDGTANRRMERMIAEMAKEAGATERLKAAYPLRWVGLMNSIKSRQKKSF